MPRIRSLRPDFFDDPRTDGLSPTARLLALGLRCQADRAGRLLDEPQRLRARILPYDRLEAGDVDAMLADLARAGIITRYESAGLRVVEIVNFVAVENPHPREAPSTLPAYPCDGFSHNYTASPVITRLAVKGQDEPGGSLSSDPGSGSGPLSSDPASLSSDARDTARGHTQGRTLCILADWSGDLGGLGARIKARRQACPVRQSESARARGLRTPRGNVRVGRLGGTRLRRLLPV